MKRDYTYLLNNTFAVGTGPNGTSFKRGQIPWNKGLKGFCAPGSEKGQFKKGQPGRNYVPVGTISIRKDKNGRSRRYIKVSNIGRIQDKWRMFSTWLWMKERGPIPSGLFVHHLDGDSMNDQTINYALVTRSAHMLLHHHQLLAAKIRHANNPGRCYTRKNI